MWFNELRVSLTREAPPPQETCSHWRVRLAGGAEWGGGWVCDLCGEHLGEGLWSRDLAESLAHAGVRLPEPAQQAAPPHRQAGALRWRLTDEDDDWISEPFTSEAEARSEAERQVREDRIPVRLWALLDEAQVRPEWVREEVDGDA